MNLNADQRALLEGLGLTVRPGDYPLTVLHLATLIAELQRRLEVLEGRRNG